MRKFKVCMLATLILIALVVVTRSHSVSNSANVPNDAQNKNLKSTDEDPFLKYIFKKLSSDSISTKFQPIILLRYDATGNKYPGDTTTVFIAGSGTMFLSPEGRYKVITAEHIFSKLGKQEYENPGYFVKVLREKNRPLTRTLVDVTPFTGSPGILDAALCTVASRSAQILPISPYSVGVAERYSARWRLCIGKPEDFVIRSLVSGQEARLLLMTEAIPGSGIWKYIVDYSSIPGESGTGFIDRKGIFYLLTGSVGDDGTRSFNDALKKTGAIDRDKPSYSMVLGAFKIDTK